MADAQDTQDAQLVIKAHFDRLLSSREFPKTICPSEVARALSATELQTAGAVSWRDLMPVVRTMAAQMRLAGELEVLQKGEVLEGDLGDDLTNLVGPIRLRKKKA